MTAIQINIERKTYITGGKKNTVIANLNLSLTANECVCLIGPSGCGKTTLLNIIAKLDPDFQGEISQTEQASSPTIGYIFQNPRLLPWRTVRENIELVLDQPQATESIDALLKDMQLEQFQQTYAEHLSLGMSRRVAIIRAFATNPELLLMDEPFVSLDAPTARHIRALLVKLWQQRPHTILLVTHNLREAISLADRLVFLSPSPLSVVHDITTTLPKNQRDNEQAVEAFYQQLLLDFPAINNLP